MLISPDKRKKRAIEKGHVLKGELLKKQLTDCEQLNDTFEYNSTYKYTVNGVKYKVKGLRSSFLPPDTIDLYYDKNPKHVFIGGGPSMMLLYVLSVTPLIEVFTIAKIIIIIFN